MIKPPTQIARMLIGNTLTKYAEIGPLPFHRDSKQLQQTN